MSFKEDIDIDHYALEEEWRKQPTLVDKYFTLHADAVYDRDKAKARYDLTLAEVEKDVRAYPNKYEMDKVTEAAVKAAVTTSETVKKAYQGYLEAKKQVMVLAGAKEGILTKKYALENEVKLFLASYFSEPAISGNHKKEVVETTSAKVKEAADKKLNANGRLKRKKL